MRTLPITAGGRREVLRWLWQTGGGERAALLFELW
jgi:hypothetical protein